MDTHLNQGTVIRKSTGIYTVMTGTHEIVNCTISSKLRKQLIYPMRDPSSLPYFKVVDVDDIESVDPVAIGDAVIFSDAMNGEGHITDVLPRRSCLTRRAPGTKPLEQVIVANVDQVAAVMSASQPAPNWNLLDRYLAGAEASEVPALVLITKIDLLHGTKAERKLLTTIDEYREIGYTVILSSANTGEGVDMVRAALKDKLSVFFGKSGVGKTTLLNAVEPSLGLRVGEINQRLDKGRHTTTHLEMFPLSFGGSIVDTPGMKQFGLWNVEPEDVAMLYPEFVPFGGTCKFGASCTHNHEPGCAIKRAVDDGAISERRYESYLYLREHLYDEGK